MSVCFQNFKEKKYTQKWPGLFFYAYNLSFRWYHRLIISTGALKLINNIPYIMLYKAYLRGSVELFFKMKEYYYIHGVYAIWFKLLKKVKKNPSWIWAQFICQLVALKSKKNFLNFNFTILTQHAQYIDLSSNTIFNFML